MKLSTKGVLEIAEHEGVVLGPYLDSKGIWTYGIGHTSAAGGLRPESMERSDTRRFTASQVERRIASAVELFDVDLDKYELRVNEAVNRAVQQHQFDALVSFDFNTGGIYRAKLTDHLNRGDVKAAARAFMGWLVPKEITKRRTAEMNLFRTGNYDGNGSSIPVYDALPDGRTRYRTSLQGRDVLRLMKRQPTGLWARLRAWWRSVISMIHNT